MKRILLCAMVVLGCSKASTVTSVAADVSEDVGADVVAPAEDVSPADAVSPSVDASADVTVS